MNVIRSEMASHPMAQAARETNSYCEKHGLQETCEHYDLKVDDVAYLANQRALRVIFAARGINLNANEAQILSLTQDEIALLPTLISAYMDGLLIGWRAREIEWNETN